MKKTSKLILLGTSSLLCISTSIGIGLYLDKTNSKPNLVESLTSNKSTEHSISPYVFQGNVLTKQAIIDLGWNQRTSITQPDWERNAPNVTQIGNINGSIEDALFTVESPLRLMQIPEKVTAIGNYAFFQAISLQEVVFHNDAKLVTIGDGAFQQSGLIKIYIPDLVTKIGVNAFAQTDDTLQGNQVSMDVKLTQGPTSPLYGFSDRQWNTIVRRNYYLGTVLNQDGITELGWSQKTSITKEDWLSAPNVEEIADPFLTSGDFTKSPFYGNLVLRSIYIPNRIKNINFSAFTNVTSLEEVIFEENQILENIRGYAFQNTGLKSITIPASVKNIDGWAFDSSRNLATVTFAPNSNLYTIAHNVFSKTGLTAINIPDSVYSVGDNAFYLTQSLKGTNVSMKHRFKQAPSVPYYGFTQEQWDGIVWRGLVLSSILNEDSFLTLEWNKKTRITLADWEAAPNVTQIGLNKHLDLGAADNSIFKGNDNTVLQSIEIPKRVTLIGNASFWGGRALKNITFEEGSNLKSIGEQAFWWTRLEAVEIPKSVSTIQRQAFAFLNRLSTVTFEKNSTLLTIGEGAFEQSAVNAIRIPDSVKTIGFNAFKYTFSLNGDKISMPRHLRADSEFGLYGLSNSQWETILWRGLFAGTTLTRDAIVTLGWDRKTIITLADWEAAPNIIHLGEPNVNSSNLINAPFSNNTVTTEIEIPNTITSIGAFAFYRTSALKKITFENGSHLETISNNAFESSAITAIRVPDSVSLIGANAFSKTTSLNGDQVSMSIRLKKGSANFLYGFTQAQWDKIDWRNLFMGGILNAAAIRTLGWDRKTIITLADWEAAPNVTQIGEKNTSIYLSNFNINSMEIPSRIITIENSAFKGATPLSKITFEAGTILRSIGDEAFSQTGLVSINIPKLVTSIGNKAFFMVSSLKTITFEPTSTLNSIGDNAFQQTGIIAINVPESVNTIGNNAFSGTTSLNGNQVSMASKLKKGSDTFLYGFTQQQWNSIVWRAFFTGQILTKQAVRELGWDRKTSITLSDWDAAPNVYQLGDPNVISGSGNDAPFSHNSILQSIEIPSRITSFNYAAFFRTRALTTVTFQADSQLENINGYVFRESAITTIKIPAATRIIREWAFESTAALKIISFEDNSILESIGESAFQNSALSFINLPGTVTTIGNNAFRGTRSLNGNQVSMIITLKQASNQPHYGFTQDQWNAINWIRVKFTERVLTKEAILFLGWDTERTITLSDWERLAPNVTEIGPSILNSNQSPFFNNKILQSIIIPKKITSIGSFAFSGTTALKLIDFEEGSVLNKIEINAFENSGLISINVPHSVINIASNAFANTASLNGSQISMTIRLKASSVEPRYGFNKRQWDTINWAVAKFTGQTLTKDAVVSLGWDSQRTITLDDWISQAPNVTQLGDPNVSSGQGNEAPFSHNGVLQSIQIPAKITAINFASFFRTSALKTITFEEGSKLSIINNSSFKESAITSIEIPASVLTLGASAFELTTSMGTITFAQNTLINTIGDAAFRGSGISAINLPDTVKIIGSNTFEQTQSLNGTSVSMVIKLKDSSVTPKYGFTSEQWETISWRRIKINDTILTKEAMSILGWDSETTITLEDWAKYAPNITQIGANDGTTSTSPFLNNSILKTIVIPKTITSIGSFAFRGASAITLITFEDNSNLETINNQAFLSTSSLATINFGKNSKLAQIGDNAFQQSGLTSIIIPELVTSIGNNAFGQTNLLIGNKVSMQIKLKGSSITPRYGFTAEQWNIIDWIRIPFTGQTLTKEVVISLDWNTEENITLTDWVKWAPNVTTIGSNNRVTGEGAFANNSILKSIQIPDKIISIEANTFTNTRSLKTVTLPYSLFIGGNSFEPQFGLTKEQWNSANWINIPEGGVLINSIIARTLLKEDSIITWEEISSYIGIQAQAFMDTNISSIRIEWKTDFTIGHNAFFNTTSLNNIEISDRYMLTIDNYGLTKDQIQNIKLIDVSQLSVTTIIISSVLAVVAVAAIASGAVIFAKITKNNKKDAIEEEYQEEYYEEELIYLNE